MARTKGARDWDYDRKRDAILRRVAGRLAERDAPRASMRQLAQAAGVSLSTLTYYFGSRSNLLAAVLEAQRWDPAAEAAPVATADLPQSVKSFSLQFVGQMGACAPSGAGDVLAVGLAEGLLDAEIAPAALRHLFEPSLASLTGRLDAHVAAGEMIDCDTRTAALMLYSSLLMLVLHQDHLGVAEIAPLDRESAVESVCAAFLRAYRSTPEPVELN